MSAATTVPFASAIAPRPTKTRSKPGLSSGSLSRTASFIIRRARFRSTAPPIFLPVINPHRTVSRPFGATFSTTRADAQLRPSRLTRAKSLLVFSVSTNERKREEGRSKKRVFWFLLLTSYFS